MSELRRALLTLLLLVTFGCASYVTPGGAVHLDDITNPDIAAVASRRPSPNFPAHIAIARVQAPNYESRSTRAYATGKFSVVTTQELMSEEQFEALDKWPQVAGVAPISRLLLPAKLESLDDLRVSAANVQADILLVYTIDTAFRIQGRGYGPLTLISLGLVPDRDANITSTASAIFVDVRTGFVYGVAEATAKATGLTNVWGSADAIDAKRLEAEKVALSRLLAESARTWSGIVEQFSVAAQVKMSANGSSAPTL